MENKELKFSDKFEFIIGKLPSIYDLNKWKEEKWLSLAEFLKYFTYIDTKANKYKWKITKEKVEYVNNQEENLDWKEFAVRINEVKPQKYYNRLSMFSAAALKFLKTNSGYITPNIESALKDNNVFNWCLDNYRKVETFIGEEIIVSDIKGGAGQIAKGKDIEKQLMEAQLKVVNIYYHIARSIKLQDLEGMKIEDKLKFLKDLQSVISQKNIYKPNSINVFNLNKNSVAELEGALLKYSQNN